MNVTITKRKFSHERSAKDNKLEKPIKYAVYILNDDYTKFNFVVMILIEIFNKTKYMARKITTTIHHGSEGLCGTYTKEVAQTKVVEATLLAELEKQPLQIIMKPVA